MKRAGRWLVLALAPLATACAGVAEADLAPDPQRRGPQGRTAQFVVECGRSHYAFDDPIVAPGLPGASHQHQFFGNTQVDADADYEDVTGAVTTCDQPLDTASYWTPTLLDPTGKLVEPHGLTAYYRVGSGIDPAEVEPYPAGLMMVAGDPGADAAQPVEIVAWSCGSGAVRESVPPECPSDSTLRMVVTFPDCWDGQRLNGFGSGAHVRYSDNACPEGFPVAVPQLTVAVDFPPVDPDGLSLSSGSMLTGHADFWNVWDQDKLEREVTACLNRDVVCGVSL
ncbi:MAG: DUF1996 domain-containing protein [Actinomycetota bacterium]